MNQFLSKEISEKQLFEMTKPGTNFDALYFCSALVLEEYRRKGIIKRLAVKAIEDIRRDYPIQCLFVWTFSKEGDMAAKALAVLTGLILLKKERADH